MSNKLNVFIIDDEAPARTLVKNYLQDHPNLELKGEYADGFNGLKAVNEFKPDLIFLDIQMPKLNGFELLELLDHKPHIIFTTAFDQYAIKAFEMSAVDYLLKPFTRERFALAVVKALKKSGENMSDEKAIERILVTRDEVPEILERVAVRYGSKIHVIASDDIIFLEAEGDYVKIHSHNGAYLKEKTMRYFETHLDPAVFVRIHRSYLVNINEIERLELYNKENHILLLKKGQKLKVSKSGYKLLREVLNI